MKIVLLASYALSLTRFRGRLIEDMIRAGHSVVCCAPDADQRVTRELAGVGAAYVPLALERTGTNPVADAGSVVRITSFLRRIRPDLLFSYTQKPVIYGSIAGRLANVPQIFAMITGLGYAFTEGPGLRRRMLRQISTKLYKLGLACADGVIFQNPDDLNDFQRLGLLSDRHRVRQVDGSGVDLDHFSRVVPPTGPLTFLLIGRLLRDKGVPEYVEAARLLHHHWPGVRFHLLGPLDTNPSAVTERELRTWIDEGVIEYLGETTDVRPHLAASSVFVLPSALREGVPHTILEAMAVGRPIITSDTPGCRETVVEGENGFLGPRHDARALAERMQRFIVEPGLCDAMGRRSRELAEQRFDVGVVNRAMFEAMGLA